MTTRGPGLFPTYDHIAQTYIFSALTNITMSTIINKTRPNYSRDNVASNYLSDPLSGLTKTPYVRVVLWSST